jgi:hypothetical protein
MQTFVYGDLYRYDVEKLEWKLISSPNSPPPRSAHQAVAWKNYVYIFGNLIWLYLDICVDLWITLDNSFGVFFLCVCAFRW